MSTSYATDLSDDQWELLMPLLPPSKSGGRPCEVSRRAILNAIFYITAAGCAWHLLPHDFPNWKTVYHYFRQWRLEGTWERIHDQLMRWERGAQGHQAAPSAASLDSQSVKTATPAAVCIGIDGGKKIKGRKRHIMVDTLGLVMMVVVTAANVSDPQGAKLIFSRLQRWPERIARLVRIWVDGTYAGKPLMHWTMDTYRWILETIKRSDTAKGFVLLPKRWVVERTFGWLNWSRRLSKDYEVLPETSEAFIYIAMIRILVRRLA
ncbi:MAG: IS5 family transposase [Cyanobacteria bacterium J06638_22]